MKTPIVILLMTCLFLVHCTKKEDETPKDEVAKAKALWESKKIDSYEMTFQVTCFCIVDLNRPAKVVVSNNKIVSVNETPYNESFMLFGSYKTIDELFIHIEEMREQNPVIEEFTFDPTYGFPSTIYYDVSQMIADEEIGYSVSDFKPE